MDFTLVIELLKAAGLLLIGAGLILSVIANNTGSKKHKG